MSYYLENPELEEGQKDIITRIKDIMGLEVDCRYTPMVGEIMLLFENVDQEGQKKLDTLCAWIDICVEQGEQRQPTTCNAIRGRASLNFEKVYYSLTSHSLGLYEGSSYNGPEGAYSLLEEMLGGKEPKLKSFD